MKTALKWIFSILGIFLIVLTVWGLNVPDENPAVPNASAGQYLDIEGMKIRYRQTGAGRDILVIHGLPGSIEDFDPLVKALGGRYRVTAYDRPGQGYSSAVGALHSVDQNAQVAQRIIEQLNLQNVIVVGHSYGGITALKMAIENMPNVSAYIALAPAANPGESADLLYQIVAGVPVLGKGILALSAAAGNSISKHKLEVGLHDAFSPNTEWLTDEFLEFRKTLWLQPSVSLAISREVPAMYVDLATMQSQYQGIKSPVLIMHGEKDIGSSVAANESVQQAIPGAKRMMLANTGHYIQIARAAEVANVIDEMAGTENRTAGQ